MKKKLLIPILLTTTAPTIAMVGCGPQPIDEGEIYVNIWDEQYHELKSEYFNVSIDEEYDIYIDVDDYKEWDSERWCRVWTVVDGHHGDYEMLEFTYVEVDGNKIDYSSTAVDTPYWSWKGDIGCLEIHNYTVNATSSLYLKAKGIKNCKGFIEFTNYE